MTRAIDKRIKKQERVILESFGYRFADTGEDGGMWIRKTPAYKIMFCVWENSVQFTISKINGSGLPVVKSLSILTNVVDRVVQMERTYFQDQPGTEELKKAVKGYWGELIKDIPGVPFLAQLK